MNNQQTRWMKFLGGNNIIFTLVVIILIGISFLLYSQLDFIINPILVIFSAILTPLIIAFILFYLLNPVVSFLEDKGIPRIWGVSLLYIFVLGLIALLMIWLFPVLQEQFEDLVNALPALFERVTDFVTNIAQNFISTENQRDAFQEVLDFFRNIETNFMNYLTEGFSSLGSIISSVTNVVVIMFLVPVILFFFLKDGSMFINGFMEKIPPKGRRDVASILAAIDSQVGNYVKGQMLIALVNGVMMFIGFSLIGLNYSGVLAVAGGILSFVPYLGPTLTFIPAVFVALSQSLWTVVLLIVVWIVIQFVEGNLIEPNIMGQRLNVHPISIIFILLIMGELLGLVGMLIGVPLYAIIKVLLTYIFSKYQKRYNLYYGEEDGKYVVEPLSTVYQVEEETNDLSNNKTES